MNPRKILQEARRSAERIKDNATPVGCSGRLSPPLDGMVASTLLWGLIFHQFGDVETSRQFGRLRDWAKKAAAHMDEIAESCGRSCEECRKTAKLLAELETIMPPTEKGSEPEAER